MNYVLNVIVIIVIKVISILNERQSSKHVKKLKDLFKEVADKFYTTTKNENCVKFTFSFL